MTAPGNPQVLELQTIPDPDPPQGQDVLVRLKAAGVNPIDTKLRQRGTFNPQAQSAILGCDGAGIVEAVGDQVIRYRPGDAVYFCHGGLGYAPGTYSQYAIVDERYLAPKPQRLSFIEAAAVPLVFITAWESLYDRARLQAIQTVLIHGGAGGVGHAAIQLAKLRGARVCTTVSSEDKATFVTQLGADLAILYREQSFITQANHWTEGKGVHAAFDTVGGSVLTQTFAAVRPYGDVVSILAPAADTDWKEARDRNLRVSLELMLTPQLQGLEDAQKHQARILEDCAQWFDQGHLKIQVSQCFPFDAAAQAHQRLAEGSLQGKIVLEIP